jgi:hypothetical protein
MLGFINNWVDREANLSRVINPDSAGKQRTQFVKATALAGRELIHKTQLDDEFLDLAAFMIIALNAIFDSIDPSVQAWEKRGYWVKADQFRMEWSWTQKLSNEMHNYWLAKDWPSVVQTAVKVLQKLGDVKIAVHHRMGKPWDGARFKLEKPPH